jgi:hypothetical protein
MEVLFSQLFCSEWSNFHIKGLLGGLNGSGGQMANKKKAKSKAPPSKTEGWAPEVVSAFTSRPPVLLEGTATRMAICP